MRWNTGLEYSLEVAHGSVHNFMGGDFGNPVIGKTDTITFATNLDTLTFVSINIF